MKFRYILALALITIFLAGMQPRFGYHAAARLRFADSPADAWFAISRLCA